MNKKEDILDAWIVIEQLSEGNINKRDRALMILESKKDDLKKFFMDFFEQEKQKLKSRLKLKEKAFEKSGIAMYFDIFNFKDVVEILRKNYNIPKSYEETINSDKFSFVLYFDDKLNFLSDKLFFTISAYVKKYGEFPKDFNKFEEDFKQELMIKFADNLDEALSFLFNKYQVDRENFRFSFVRNLDNDSVNLHSFFIKDLKKAKNISNANLNRYFSGFLGEFKNLDSKCDSPNFNPKVFEEILEPKNYPLGRFPSNPDFALSFMQQVAVNLALNDSNALRSVNGPPGTGKTTLLKDIFADLIVKQAYEIAKLSSKYIIGEEFYFKSGKLGLLPENIWDKNIIVASSNNGAVQNIVKELPKRKEIADEFLSSLEDMDYFKEISNFKENEEDLKDENWGNFSLEGGASANISKLILNVEKMENYLENEYEANFDIYKIFLNAYEELSAKRAKVQSYHEDIKLLFVLLKELERDALRFEKEKNEKEKNIKQSEENSSFELDKLRFDGEKLGKNLQNIDNKLKINNDYFENAKRNFDIIYLKKPSFLWLFKIFFKSKAQKYLNELNLALETLDKITDEKNELLKKKNAIIFEQNNNHEAIKIVSNRTKKLQDDFSAWCDEEEKIKITKEKKVLFLQEEKAKSNICELDFSKSYEDLQKSNPWFDKQFRILQSKLFILALGVKKQFLYENIKNLKASINIWKNKDSTLSRENGIKLINESWQWINLAIPVISTTFASFGRMFDGFGENSLGNLFIDEAGQALPQASVGGIYRSKKLMVVGDPSQIKPVLTLDNGLLNLLAHHHEVDENFISVDASTQSLVDRASQYGYIKKDGERIGIPLWVHRRSNYPMFTISNVISYDGLMVQGKAKNKSQGKAKWYDEKGSADDKFVKSQSDLLVKLLSEKLANNPALKENIYVISPFRNVAYKLAEDLKKIKFTKYENSKPVNVGTVHTFQGKEANIVYLVLGADTNSKGAAKWAVANANIMNVAATRAKEEFYIIADKELYLSLGSQVANDTIKIIDKYNETCTS